jgi:hypothetical protein
MILESNDFGEYFIPDNYGCIPWKCELLKI